MVNQAPSQPAGLLRGLRDRCAHPTPPPLGQRSPPGKLHLGSSAVGAGPSADREDQGRGAALAWAGRLSLEGRRCGRCGEEATCRERRPGSCTEGGEICKLLLPHGCSSRSIHIEMRPARASSAAGPCHASARPAACQLGQWGWQGLPALGAYSRPWGQEGEGGGGRVTPATQAPQFRRPWPRNWGASRRERTRTDGFWRGAGIDAAAPRRCGPAALLSICRCSHLPVNKSILQFNAAASRPSETDAAAELPPPSPLPSRGASG